MACFYRMVQPRNTARRVRRVHAVMRSNIMGAHNGSQPLQAAPAAAAAPTAAAAALALHRSDGSSSSSGTSNACRAAGMLLILIRVLKCDPLQLCRT